MNDRWPQDVESRKRFLVNHTMEELCELLCISPTKVYRLEKEYGVHCKRYCQHHKTFHFATEFDYGDERLFKGSCRNSTLGKNADSERKQAEYELCRLDVDFPATIGSHPIPYPCTAAGPWVEGV